MNIQGLPTMTRYIHGFLRLTVNIHGPLIAGMPNIHGLTMLVVCVGLMVTVNIHGPLMAGWP